MPTDPTRSAVKHQRDADVLQPEAKFRGLLEAAPDAMIIVNREGRITLINSQTERIFGYSREELLGQLVDILIPTGFRDSHQGHRAKYFGDPHHRPMGTLQVSALRKDGAEFPVEISLSPVETEEGMVAIAAVRDISARIAVEQALAAANHELSRRELAATEAQFAQIADAIEEAFFVFEADFERTIYINSAYETIWGRSRQSLYEDPRSFLAGVHPDDRPTLVADLKRIREGGGAGRVEFRVLRPDGAERHILSRAVGVRDEEGTVTRISGVALDVSDARRLQTQLDQVQKMEAIGRLAGGVAHDFNNLLTIITSYSSILIQDTAPNHPHVADLKEIAAAAESAASLTRQLLAFARQQVIAPQVITLEPALAKAERMLRRLIGEDVRLVTDFHAPADRVRIDPGQLEQVVFNLAVNARDAMPMGGTLTFSTWSVSPGASAKVPITRPSVVLAVHDDGVGMDKATQARIFEPFYTTKPEGRGTGLGLSTAYAIIAQAEGHIEVESEPGKGTTFTIYLPLAAEDEDASHGDAGSHSTDAPATILVCEDSPSVRATMRRVLERAGHTVLEAPDGDHAIAIATAFAGGIDLLLTDVVLPGLSGRTVAERFREVRPAARILFVSGYTDDEVVRQGVESAHLAFLQKPFTPDRLLERVAEVLREDRWAGRLSSRH